MILAYSKVSDGNMDFRFGALKKVLSNRKKFLKKLGVCLENIVEVNQVHGNSVILVEKVIGPQTDADGMITNKPGLYLMVKLADCIPVAFYDHEHRAIGLIHAGRKGLEKEIIKKAVDKMKQSFHTDPKDLVVNLGPSIGPRCYKQSLKASLKNKFSSSAYRANLWKDAENQLTACGILKANIDNPKICTYEGKEYFSHRRAEDKNLPESRFVTILGINNAG